jgi:DNA-directed RNA polymerase subunit M/transcription elongation factor TFIIS
VTVFGKLLCWLGYHKWGNTWQVRNEYEELDAVTFVECMRCGECWRVI